jgi:hypothetical protein
VHGRELLVFRIDSHDEKPAFEMRLKLDLNGEVSAFSVLGMSESSFWFCLQNIILCQVFRQNKSFLLEFGAETLARNGEEKTCIALAKWEPCEFCVYVDWESGNLTPMKNVGSLSSVNFFTTRWMIDIFVGDKLLMISIDGAIEQL